MADVFLIIYGKSRLQTVVSSDAYFLVCAEPPVCVTDFTGVNRHRQFCWDGVYIHTREQTAVGSRPCASTHVLKHGAGFTNAKCCVQWHW